VLGAWPAFRGAGGAPLGGVAGADANWCGFTRVEIERLAGLPRAALDFSSIK